MSRESDNKELLRIPMISSEGVLSRRTIIHDYFTNHTTTLFPGTAVGLADNPAGDPVLWPSGWGAPPTGGRDPIRVIGLVGGNPATDRWDSGASPVPVVVRGLQWGYTLDTELFPGDIVVPAVSAGNSGGALVADNSPDPGKIVGRCMSKKGDFFQSNVYLINVGLG